MTHGWASWLTLAAAVIAASAGLTAAIAIQRRNAPRDDQAARLRAARRATRQIARDNHRRGQGNLRGEGMGGDTSLASDASSVGDGGTP